MPSQIELESLIDCAADRERKTTALEALHRLLTREQYLDRDTALLLVEVGLSLDVGGRLGRPVIEVVVSNGVSAQGA